MPCHMQDRASMAFNKKWAAQRPFLQLCKKCGGKGQLSFLDRYQRKTYGGAWVESIQRHTHAHACCLRTWLPYCCGMKSAPLHACFLAAPCDHCSSGDGPYALGVSLKCRCQKPGVPYTFLLGHQVCQQCPFPSEMKSTSLSLSLS